MPRQIEHTPLGDQQLTVDSTAGGVALTVPDGAVLAIMRLETASIRYRDDGIAPSTTVGMLMNAGDALEYDGDLTAFRAIRTTGTSGLLDINYYGPGGAK